MSDQKYGYTLTRHALPPAETKGKPVGTTIREAPTPWFLGFRDGTHAMLSIFGELAMSGIPDLDALLLDAKSCSVTLSNCPGGDVGMSNYLCRRLEKIGRDAVNVMVRGFCNSSANDVLACAGRVHANSNCSFLLHGPSLTLFKEEDGTLLNSPLEATLDLLDLSYLEGSIHLRKRIDPTPFLDGRDHTIDADHALKIGLIDKIEYQLA